MTNSIIPIRGEVRGIHPEVGDILVLADDDGVARNFTIQWVEYGDPAKVGVGYGHPSELVTLEIGAKEQFIAIHYGDQVSIRRKKVATAEEKLELLVTRLKDGEAWGLSIDAVRQLLAEIGEDS